MPTKILLLATVLAASAPVSAEPLPHVGREIAGFRLQDCLGSWHELDDFAESRLVVVAFVGTECPLAKLYAGRLAELAARYDGRDVAFVGIDSNQQDTPTEIAHFARAHGIEFPMLKDPGSVVADQFGAERTPEVFVLDQQRTVRYWGRIDDQFGVGYARPEVTRSFLAEALDELLAGRPVSNSEEPSVGCHIGRVVRSAARGEITYARQISRVLERRCVECHRSQGIGPFSLTSYEEVAPWAETLREVVRDGRMPPWHADPAYGQFANDARMPESEKQLLYDWVENGVPEGSPADLPARREFVEGWRIGEPDLVLSMPEPFTVPAQGVVPYQYFEVDPGFSEGRWVRASEARPGNRSVVHHIVVFVQPPGADPVLEDEGIGFEILGGYVPGSPPMELQDGVARFIPPHSKLVFQMHYTPNGRQQTDQSEIGLVFTDGQQVRKTVQTGVAVNLDFTIPPHAKNHRVQATHRFSHEMMLHSLIPHMHYRGTAFRYEAIYPNGTREILLDVPRYDFNWQNTYRLIQPKLMPEGTLLRCTAQYDNSADNLSNPDPTLPVRWGEQTWEEMMIGYFEGVYSNQDLALPGPQITPLGDGRFEVLFSYRPDRPAQSVHLAGTFNEWSNQAHPMSGPDERGFYLRRLQLDAGDYRYKFVVDGDLWTHDPASRQLTGFFQESFLVVGPADAE